MVTCYNQLQQLRIHSRLISREIDKILNSHAHLNFALGHVQMYSWRCPCIIYMHVENPPLRNPPETEKACQLSDILVSNQTLNRG